MTAQITVTVLASDGSTVAVRRDNLILRTLRTPPYSAIIGSRDATSAQAVPDTADGEDAGTAPATPNPCASPSQSSDDTVVRVAYVNAQSGACSDGSSWHDAAYRQSSSAPSGWSP